MKRVHLSVALVYVVLSGCVMPPKPATQPKDEHKLSIEQMRRWS